MDEKEFKDRTKQIALRIIRLAESLPKTSSAQIIGKQLLRSTTSVGANYRAACRGKSESDVLHKLAIVEEEADESLYRLELLAESETISKNKLAALMRDLDEIVAMTAASIKTMRAKKIGQYKELINPKSKI
jgi:four helix bundle protein